MAFGVALEGRLFGGGVGIVRFELGCDGEDEERYDEDENVCHEK